MLGEELIVEAQKIINKMQKNNFKDKISYQIQKISKRNIRIQLFSGTKI